MTTAGSILLTLALSASPGALDRNGGHIDFWTSEYHVHTPPSYQFQYVDAAGHVWAGQGPRPEENLLDYREDFIWDTPFIPTLVIASLVFLAAYLKAEAWIARWHYRRVVEAKKRAYVEEVRRIPVLAPPGFAARAPITSKSYEGENRRKKDRRRHERRAA
jgi:hypothetical protein